ncbi:MAG: DUF1559 domain-containing protein [Tepidisphaerales bacterium]
MIIVDSSKSFRCRAFSLTELLAAIAVIALLLSMLLPGLSLARSAAQRTQCAANLAQIGRALTQYASANKGLIPRGTTLATPHDPPWAAIVARELGLRSPFTWADIAALPTLHCPAHPTPDAVSHFVINAFQSASATEPTAAPAGLTQVARLRPASEIPLMLETPPLFQSMLFFPMDDIYSEFARFVSSSAHLVGGTHARLGVANHGRGKSNVLFADGHVEVLDNATLLPADFMPKSP